MPNPRTAGESIQDFTLSGLDGRTYDSRDARRKGLLLFAIYKMGCGTCQYTMPFLQRFHQEYAGEGFQLWGVAQDSADETREFGEQFGVTFPLLLDTDLTVTYAYGLTHVPGIYLVDESDAILRHAPAFAKDELNAMAQVVAERCSIPYVPVVRDEDNAPAFKPG
jgi:peroxiredoxin